VRTEHALESGIAVPPYYDSMLAKLIAHAATREAAREKLALALEETIALGLPTNKAFLAAVLRDADFAAGSATTAFLDGRCFAEPAPDEALLEHAGRLLAGDHGEWTGWSNNPAQGGRAKFGGKVVAFGFADRPDGIQAHVVDGDTVHLARGGASFSLRNTLYDPPQKRVAGASDGRLVAPMNGRVVAVNARVGDTVDAGKALVVLEAMKMEHGLDLPFALKVSAIHVAPGAQVAPGKLLMEFDPA